MQLDQSTRRDLYRLGLRGLGSVHAGQNLVLDADWRGRRLIAKVRSEQGRYRLDKERHWLARARELGLPVPSPIALLTGPRLRALLMSRAPQRARRPSSARAWRDLLEPLHRAEAPAGWGPLRADDRPRWGSRLQAAQWYRSLAQQLNGETERRCHALIAAFFAAARPALVHGDPHAGNLRGGLLLDWEHVAVGDPLEDAARACLGGGWSEAAWCRAWNVDPQHPRWCGACCCAALEALSFGGPRRAAAQRWLARL